MKIRIETVLAWACAAGILVFLICHFVSQPISSSSMDAVKEAVLGRVNVSAMNEGDHQMIRRLYGLNPSEYEDMVLYYPSTNMGAEEVLIVKLTEVSQGETVRTAIEKRLETQKNSFDGYGIEQYEMLSSHAVIEIHGNYVLFVVSNTAESAREAFLKAL